jgi:hypothetical protein
MCQAGVLAGEAKGSAAPRTVVEEVVLVARQRVGRDGTNRRHPLRGGPGAEQPEMGRAHRPRRQGVLQPGQVVEVRGLRRK